MGAPEAGRATGAIACQPCARGSTVLVIFAEEMGAAKNTAVLPLAEALMAVDRAEMRC